MSIVPASRNYRINTISQAKQAHGDELYKSDYGYLAGWFH